MCFVLYLGSDKPVPTIPWNQAKPALNTQDLTPRDARVSIHLDKPHKKYVGSQHGCGCGFRHVGFYNGAWPEEDLIGSAHYTGEEQQPIHQELYHFLSGILHEAGDIELYGCWDGDWNEPRGGEGDLSLDQILDTRFFFRERYTYHIKKTVHPPSAGC